MQKFTVFSIILSFSLILMIGDLVFHDYLNRDGAEDVVIEEETLMEEAPATEPELSEATEPEESPVLQSEEETIVIPETAISDSLFTQAGFLDPILKDTIFSGLVFQFISFSDQTDAFVYQWNLFDGESYVGSIYEMVYPTETGSFQGYLALRERATALTDLGTVNEVNNYGEASFYFNHKTKTKTVHLIIRKGAKIFAFEYGQASHETMKKVFGLL